VLERRGLHSGRLFLGRQKSKRDVLTRSGSVTRLESEEKTSVPHRRDLLDKTSPRGERVSSMGEGGGEEIDLTGGYPQDGRSFGLRPILRKRRIFTQKTGGRVSPLIGPRLTDGSSLAERCKTQNLAGK